MNYSAWPLKDERIGSIFLDPKNPRLPRRSKPYTQLEIIAELVKHSDVYELAKSISGGYIRMEIPVIYKDDEDGKKYVLEGNRRFTACKLLLNPDLAPEEYRAKYKRLSKQVNQAEISKLTVLVAPDRVSALKMIVKKHTKTQVEQWKPVMKAHFYAQPVEDGMSVEEAAEMLGVPEGDIREAITSLQLYDAAKNLEVDDEISKIVNDEYKFELSTFNRVVTKPVGKEFLGIETDNEGNVLVTVDRKEFEKGLRKIVTDLATEKENSRSLNKVEDIAKYFKERVSKEDTPDSTKKTEAQKLKELFKEPEVEKKPETKVEDKKETPKPRPKRETPPVGLIPKNSIICQLNNDKVKDIISELETLSPAKYPNACAMSLRMLLELSTYEFLDAIGEIDQWKSELESQGVPEKKRKDWMPQLSEMINRILHKKLIDDVPLLRNLGLFKRDDSTNPILKSLNQFVHNSKWHPTEDKLRNIWKDLSPYIAKTVEGKVEIPDEK